MLRRGAPLLVLVLVLVLVLLKVCLAQTRFEREISTGIRYVCLKKLGVRLHVLKAALAHPRLQIRAALAKDRIGRLETVRSLAKRNKALAAVNGSFFDQRRRAHLPVGLIVIDGKVLNKSLLNRTTLGVIPEKRIIFGIPKIKGKITNLQSGESFHIWGVNRPRKENEVVLYTPEYGWRTGTNPFGAEVLVESGEVVGIGAENSPIPRNGYVLSFHGWTRSYANRLSPGTRLKVEWGFSDEWEKVSYALTGGPRLIENGKVVVSSALKEENFRGGLLSPHARTAIGLTRGGELLMVVAEGKRKGGRTSGITYPQLAYLMLNMDAIDAMGLDGGGVSAMYLQGRVVNRPEKGYEQGVSNILFIRLRD